MTKQSLKSLPNSPGVYLMKDAQGRVIYVGKAASLKKRVSSYFKPKAALDTKTRILVENIANFDYLLTASEAEALLLEHSLITQYKPKYNISLKDDKRYPLIKVTVNEKFPRILIARRKKDDGAIYYGRYTNATLLRQALAIMRQLFPLRTCRTMPKTACLNYHIGQCIGPCIGKCSKKEYDQVVKEVRLFLEGKKQKLIGELTKRMQAASASRNYETAAKLRDRIQALTAVTKHRKPTRFVGTNLVGLHRQALDELRLALGLGKTPLRIEAFDVSNIFGHEAVGSMISFFDAAPDKKEYKRFKIRSFSGIDDYRMIDEIVTRRYKRILRESLKLPDLIIIDGGKGHVSVARQALKKLGLKHFPVVGISKKLERLHTAERKTPIILKRDSKALELVMRVRDEAHRFAQSYHHILRGKLTKASVVDGIPGIGTKRKKQLLENMSLFELKVYKAASEIPKGQTRSYLWIAKQIGLPRASRAVGNALNKNPFPGIIPCHRVIKSDGSLGGFSRGQKAKKALLKAEKK